MHDPDGGAVLWRLSEKIVRSLQPARPRHALHDEAWIAGDMAPHMLGDDARILRIAAGNAGRDHDADGLAAIERRALLCLRAGGCRRQTGRHANRKRDRGKPHATEPQPALVAVKCSALSILKRCSETSVRPLDLAPSENADTCRISRSTSPTFSNQERE